MWGAEGLAALLVFARVGPVALSVSAFTKGFVPMGIGLSLGLALTSALMSVAGPLPPLDGPGALVLALLRELCIGGAFALAVALAVSVVVWALSLAHIELDQLGAGALRAAYALAAGALVLSLGGHRALVIGLAESYTDAALGGARLSVRAFGLGVVQLVADALSTAFGIALPLLVSALALDVLLAFAVRLSSPAALPLARLARPLAFTIAAALLLAPIAARAPEAVRAGIFAARALTRALAR